MASVFFAHGAALLMTEFVFVPDGLPERVLYTSFDDAQKLV